MDFPAFQVTVNSNSVAFANEAAPRSLADDSKGADERLKIAARGGCARGVHSTCQLNDICAK